MIKTIFTLLISFLFHHLLISQEFVYSPTGVYDTWGIMSVLEFKDHYLLSESEQYSSTDYSRCKLTLIDKSGKYISDTIIPFENYAQVTELQNVNGAPSLTFIGVGPDFTNNKFVEYNALSKDRLEIPFQMRVTSLFNDILTLGNSYYFGIYNGRKLNVIRVDKNLQQAMISVDLKIAPLDISKSLNDEFIIVKGLSGIEILNLSLDTTFYVHEDFDLGDFVGDIIPIKSRNHYINTGGHILAINQFNGPDTVDFGISILDHKFKTVKLIDIGRPGDTVDIPARSKSISIMDGGYYFGGTSNFHVWYYPYGFQPSWFVFCKTDSLLNIVWKKEYGGDAYYFMHGIITTSDGGCLAYGTRQDTTHGNYNRDAFLIKLDKNGLLVFNKTILPDAKAGFTLYPNPTRDQLNIVLNGDPRSCQIKLYNLSGAEIKVYPVLPADKVYKLQVSGLAPGEYILKAFDEKQNPIGTGRFVKM